MSNSENQNTSLVPLQHILNVIDERILLYRKRTVETKRAIKAMSRANLPIDPIAFQIMLEAEIIFATNLVGRELLQEVLNRNHKKQISYEEVMLLSEDLKKSFVKLIKKSQSILYYLDQKYLETLFDIILTLDADFERLIINEIIFYNLRTLIDIIFKEIVIFDSNYKENVIKIVKKFLKNQLNF